MWYPPEDALKDDYYGWGYTIDQVGQLRLIDYDCCCNDDWAPRNHVATRSTGQLNEKGQEIFSGDIISWANGNIVGEVLEGNNGEWLINPIKPRGVLVGLEERVMGGDVEILGNIYENPELIST